VLCLEVGDDGTCDTFFRCMNVDFDRISILCISEPIDKCTEQYVSNFLLVQKCQAWLYPIKLVHHPPHCLTFICMTAYCVLNLHHSTSFSIHMHCNENSNASMYSHTISIKVIL
jgi:hypothetical protein